MALGVIRDLLALVGALASVVALVVTVAHYYRLWVWTRKLTWDDALRVAERLLGHIEAQDWKPDLVVGLGRSGGIWGGWLAGNLGSLPLTVLEVRYDRTLRGRTVGFPAGAEMLSLIRATYGDRVRRVLVVEGATSTGQTPGEFLSQFAAQLRGWEVKLAVLYKNPASMAAVDFVGKGDLEPWPDQFPWHLRSAYRPHLRDVVLPKAEDHNRRAA